MKVSPPKSNSVKRVLISRGVPRRLFDIAPFNLKNKLSPFGKHPVSTQQQIQQLKKVIDDPLHSPYLYVMSGNHYSDIVSAIALCIAATVVVDLGLGSSKHCVWHYIKFGKDDSETNLAARRPSLLILDGLLAESNIMRIERARDILLKNSGIPRILLVAGTEPITFMQNRLRLKPDYALYVAEQTKILEI
jgi:hypothetical protein